MFVRSGVVSDDIVINIAGVSSRAWSSRAYIEAPFTDSYYLGFGLPIVGPSSAAGRRFGMSLRCLVVGKV